MLPDKIIGTLNNPLVKNMLIINFPNLDDILLLFLYHRDEVNKAYRKLAVLLHPDKNVAPGSEEAFKILVQARTELLKSTR